MSGITIWGGKLATAEAALAQATASGYEFAKVVTAMSAIYSLPSIRYRKGWLHLLSKLTCMATFVVCSGSDNSATPDQMNVIATVCAFLVKLPKNGSPMPPNENVLFGVRDQVVRSIKALVALPEIGGHTLSLLRINEVQLSLLLPPLVNEDDDKLVFDMMFLYLMIQYSVPTIVDHCQRARVYRSYGLLCVEFRQYRWAIFSFLQAHGSVSLRVLDVQLKNLLAWGSLVGFRH